MNQEFRLAKGWAIFAWIILPVFMVLVGALGVMPFFKDEFNWVLAIILVPISLLLEFVGIMAIMELIKGKLIISNDRITIVEAFKTKTLLFTDIKGYRQIQGYLTFFPIDQQKKKIKANTYYGNSARLLAWVYQNFKDLDHEETINDEQEIFKNEEYGRTSKERKNKLKKAKKITKILNISAWVVAAFLWFYPEFYKIQIMLCALIPIIGLIVMNRSKGLIRLDEKTNSARPNILSTVFIPSLALLIRSSKDCEIFDYSNFWNYAIVICLILFIMVVKELKENYNFKQGTTYVALIGFLMFGAMYTYGLIITSNLAFNDNEPSAYKTEVLEKRISTGKHTSYYLKIDKWGPQNEIEEVSVSKSMYEKKKIGDSAIVYFNTGALDIPYYMVVD
ncbi:hypothetical protein EYV94_13520 [Puteibacter caeruleilacunae]|nr:hypothetical protein EYV94_13520 [Puteibacter caeruleilacunae]